MKSKIYTEEAVENTERKFGECMEYVPVMVDNKPALFTRYQIDQAIARAERQPEDIPGKEF